VTEYRLLVEFRGLFAGTKYEHRRSNLGDFVAMHLYEDLVAIKRSDRYVLSVESMASVMNAQNKRKGVEARRGDGTFGELILGERAVIDPGYKVARGPVANVEIGVEVKILAKAMIKQIDRVKNDLANQVQQFRRRAGSRNPICVGIVGVNHANVVTSWEGDRSYRTDGAKYKHPIQEAKEATRRLNEVAEAYDEFLILPYRATNEHPYSFEWVDEKDTRQNYVAALQRISNEYQARF
jgi:hypothetical protein